MSQKYSISAIIITKNEAMRIGSCIDALKFCDEIIIADNDSTDETVAIARAHKAIVTTFHADDFAKLRNDAAKQAKGDWLLYIDADEVVGDGLAHIIRDTVDAWHPGAPSSYRLHRINYYLSNRWPGSEWMLRLFKRTALKGWKGELHETALTVGEIGDLVGELKHDTHRSLASMVAKTNEWSETEAALRFSAHHPKISWWRLLRVTCTGFWESFIYRKGYRAGTVGWIESIYQGFSLFITYAKLWELQQKK